MTPIICIACLEGDHGSILSELAHQEQRCDCACNVKPKCKEPQPS